jgi:mannose-6-phosphate isomerase-like protein (cupin superfamily)
MEEREIINAGADERIVFRVIAEESDGELLELDDFWGHPEHEVVEHRHPAMEETWHVIAGSVEFRIGEVDVYAGPGDIVVAPAGVQHSARNVGGPAHIRVQMRPALRWAEFVVEYFAIENSADTTDADIAQLLSKYASEIVI